MSLSSREKQMFYDHLGQLLRAGIPMAAAVEKLIRTSSGPVATFLRSLGRELAGGGTISEAFQNARPPLSEMERTAIGAMARSGQLETGLVQLSVYFGELHKARAEVLRRLAYPIFLLHFGVLMVNAATVVTVGWQEYLRRCGTVFLTLYVCLAIVGVLVPFLRDAGSFVPFVDSLLRKLPFVGKVRRAFALSRFCATYNMQLDAGVSVIEGLRAAGLASRSGLIRAAVVGALPDLRRGEQVGALLARYSGAFPIDMLQAFIVAEETGSLDARLRGLAGEYQEEAFRRLKTASIWIPKLIYIGILLYTAWQIVGVYKTSGILDPQGQIDAMMKDL